jgi:hypothetical protein
MHVTTSSGIPHLSPYHLSSHPSSCRHACQVAAVLAGCPLCPVDETWLPDENWLKAALGKKVFHAPTDTCKSRDLYPQKRFVLCHVTMDTPVTNVTFGNPRSQVQVQVLVQNSLPYGA